MKQADGYLLRKVAEDYVLVPYGKRTEEVSQLIEAMEEKEKKMELEYETKRR